MPKPLKKTTINLHTIKKTQENNQKVNLKSNTYFKEERLKESPELEPALKAAGHNPASSGAPPRNRSRNTELGLKSNSRSRIPP